MRTPINVTDLQETHTRVVTYYHGFFFAGKLIINICSLEVYDFEILAYNKTVRLEYMFFNLIFLNNCL